MTMKTHIKKLISMVTAAAMIMTMMPQTAVYAAGEEMVEAGNAQEDKEETHIEAPRAVEDVSREDAVEEENTESSTTYDLGGNEKLLVIYESNVRFRDEDIRSMAI